MELTHYTIDLISSHSQFDDDLVQFLCEEGPKIAAMFGDQYSFEKFNFTKFFLGGSMFVCKKGEKVDGIMLFVIFKSPWDRETVILKQHLLYVKSRGKSRTAYRLMQHFIDFGKANANHIVTMIGENTNISRRSLERLGFTKIEEIYRMET